MVIEPLLRPCQRERHSAGVSLREQGIALTVAQFLLNTPQEPLITPAIAVILQQGSIQLQPIIARVWKLVYVEQAQEMRKLAGVTTVWCRCKEENTLIARRKALCKLIPFRLGYLLTLG